MNRTHRCCDCHYCANRTDFAADHACRKLALPLTPGEYLERHGCTCFKPLEPKYVPPSVSDGRDYEYLLNRKEPDHASDGL